MNRLSKRTKRILGILLVLVFLLFVLPLLIPLPPVGVEAESLADPDGRFIEVDGMSTYLQEQGDESAPVVLLLHGWAASTVSWRETIAPVAEAGYRVIAFDRPPYGLSQKTGENLPLAPSEQADFTAALMNELGIEQATLVGHSMGGSVIAYFAVRYPERVEKLVFVDGAVGLNADESGPGSPLLTSLVHFAPVNRWARIGMRLFLRPELFTDLQKSAYYDPNVVTPEVAAGYQRSLKVVGWDEALLDIFFGRPTADAPLTREQLEGVTAPSLLVWGENDTWVPIAVGERLRDELPNARWLTYPEVGHLPMEEKPDEFNTDLIAFLSAEL
ncbi:MAG: alpha/beta hydrolase [Chloroflexi bacterium]|nr:alpha/beta hydrolase [Chloroflexota bacterium]